MKNYGQNIIKNLKLNDKNHYNLADGIYNYDFYRIKKGKEVKIEKLNNYCIYCLDAKKLKVNVNNETFVLNKGDSINVSNYSSYIMSESDSDILVAGCNDLNNESKYCNITAEDEHYRVKKPWGYEIWITGKVNKYYCLKKIYIKKGEKTSLQYHHFKKETNLLFEGKAKLHYKGNKNVENDSVTEKDIDITEINHITSVDVSPNIIHRLESLTDIILYEVSTPHLDDVIRIQDDTARSDGRIEAEHT